MDSILVLWCLDANRFFELYTEWSAIGFEVVLIQKDDIRFKYIIVFASRNNNNAESNYSFYEGKSLGVI